MPDKLNFAIEGSLQITQGDTTTTCDNILLAQGHIPLLFTYNWWFGSPEAKSASVPYIGPLIIACDEQTESAQTSNAKVPSRPSLPTLLMVSPPQPCVNNFSLVIN